MARLGGLDRNRHRLEIAHLADEDDVGILAQRRAQRALERVGVRPDLALVDEALLVVVHELDRILDRDDVVVAVPVDVVDHRAERRRLARAGRPGHEHEALRQPAQLQDVRREAELLGGQDLARNHAEDGARPLAIHEDVGAEPREPDDLVREVRVVPGGELARVLVGNDRPEELPQMVAGSSGAAPASSGCMRPSLRMSGGIPTVRWRSDAPARRHRPEQPIDGRSRRPGRSAAARPLVPLPRYGRAAVLRPPGGRADGRAVSAPPPRPMARPTRVRERQRQRSPTRYVTIKRSLSRAIVTLKGPTEGDV